MVLKEDCTVSRELKESMESCESSLGGCCCRGSVGTMEVRWGDGSELGREVEGPVAGAASCARLLPRRDRVGIEPKLGNPAGFFFIVV